MKETPTLRGQLAGLESVVNARDLGGYVVGDGRRVRRGLLFRGGALNRLSDYDLEKMRSVMGVVCCFDFRTEGETLSAPDRKIPGVEYVWLPAIDEHSGRLDKMSLPPLAYRNLDTWLPDHANEPFVQEVASGMYTELILNEYTQLQYAAFFQKILSYPEGSFYWHCSQGKDRTGLGAALMLAALGADRETIMADYALSNEWYRDEVAQVMEALRSRGSTPEAEAVIQTFIGVNCQYFEEALDCIDREFGSMDSFLEVTICLTADDREALKARFLE